MISSAKLPLPVMITCINDGLTVGVGFTVTVAVVDGPGQPLAVGVIVKVVVWIVLVLLVSVPEIGLADPDAGIPVMFTVLVLVHVNVVPPTAPLSAIAVIAVPEQMVCDGGVATAFGVGFTSTVAVVVGPAHPPAVGVIVNVTVTGAAVVLVSVPLILPVPLAAIPVTATVLSLVHV